MIGLLFVLLASVCVVLCGEHTHVCIHDRLMAKHKLWDPALEEAKRQLPPPKATPAPTKGADATFTKIRIHFDFSFFNASFDTDRLCTSVGQWVMSGTPKNNTAGQHLPVCHSRCDEDDTCDCWYQCDEKDVLTKEKADFMTQQMFPAAELWFESALQVERLPFSLSAPNCGCGDGSLPIPNSLFARYENVVDQDLVVFVTARTTRFLAQTTLAYACACQINQIGRPVFAHITWGLNTLTNLNHSDLFQQWLGVAFHELTHALGFGRAHFERFFDTEVPYDVYDKRTTYPRVPLDQVIRSVRRTVDVRGANLSHDVTLVVLPKVLDIAKRHFGCDTMDGVELEDQGSAGTMSSHWEKRILNDEYMTATSHYLPKKTALTLAMLEASGWYRVNYAVAENQTYGHGEGCAFVAPRCDQWHDAYRCADANRGDWGCIWDRTQRGRCSLIVYSNELDPFYVYDTLHPNEGGSPLADYCAFYDFAGMGDCAQPLYQIDNLEQRGEVFDKTSRW